MIEKTVLDYLNTQLTPTVYMQEPEHKNPLGETFVVLQKTGSSCENFIFTATFAIQSYAPSLYEAASLNEDVKAAMFNIIDEDEITRVDLVSDYEYTKISTKQPRYQAVFEITHYQGGSVEEDGE